jgi:hypothetical protein
MITWDRQRGTMLAAGLAGLLTAACAHSQPSGEGSTTTQAKAAAGSWQFDHNQSLCLIRKQIDGRPFMLSLMKLPKSKDGGIVMLYFADSSFSLPSDNRTSVVLQFDSGTIDGYSIERAKDAADPKVSFDVGMTTYLLKNIVSVMAKASSLTVTAESASTTFRLDGFGDAVTWLRQCADDYEMKA